MWWLVIILCCLNVMPLPVLPVLQLLEAYLLQAVPGEALADKVLSCFRGMLQDVATRLVRSTVLARLAFQQPAGADDASAPPGGGSGDRGFSSVLEEGSFAELCRRVPPESLGPCLLKLLESMFDQLASYAGMEQWQAAGLAQHSQAAAAAAAAAAVAAAPLAAAQLRDATSDAPPDAAASQQQQLDHVQAATKSMLSAVHAALVSNRVSFAETASVLLKDLLVGAGGCRGSDLPQVCLAPQTWRQCCEVRGTSLCCVRINRAASPCRVCVSRAGG
jgi:hypothetical protein